MNPFREQCFQARTYGFNKLSFKLGNKLFEVIKPFRVFLSDRCQNNPLKLLKKILNLIVSITSVCKKDTATFQVKWKSVQSLNIMDTAGSYKELPYELDHSFWKFPEIVRNLITL